MNRVANLAANNQIVNLLMRTQARVSDLQTQLASEKVSQDYAGIPRDSERLLSLENARALTGRFKENNEVMQTRLGVADAAVASVDETLRDFRGVLLSASSEPLDAAGARDLQTYAFRALQEMESALNAKADGRYVFAGSRVTTEPVDLGLTTLEAFQARYDGGTKLYPDTRDAHLQGFTLSANAVDNNADWLVFERDPLNSGLSRITAPNTEFAGIAPGSDITITGTPGQTNDGTYTVVGVGGGGQYLEVATKKFVAESPPNATFSTPDGVSLSFTDLQFADDGTTSTVSTNAGGFADLAAGDVFEVRGTQFNDGVYRIESKTATTITIATSTLSDQGTVTPVAGTVSAASYYSGDSLVQTHRADEQRSLALDLNAVNPAFEKAIRAMGIIAQGAFGTEGGLEQNQGRIAQAIGLLNSALDGTPAADVSELEGNLADVRMRIGFDQVVLDEAAARQRDLEASLDIQIAGIENVDTTEVITKLLDESRALEASYRALARIRSLSLTKFL